MRSLPLDKVYRLIEPGPVVLLATSDRGIANVMAMSWHMMVEFTPPQVAGIVSNRNHSFGALRRSKDCVIAIPPAAMAQTVVAIGNCSGADTDKVARFALATRPARHVAPPLLADCIANLECRVADTRMVNAYCLFILEVVHAWSNPALRGAPTLHHQGLGTLRAGRGGDPHSLPQGVAAPGGQPARMTAGVPDRSAIRARIASSRGPSRSTGAQAWAS